jgi:hypothetical protein
MIINMTKKLYLLEIYLDKIKRKKGCKSWI